MIDLLRLDTGPGIATVPIRGVVSPEFHRLIRRFARDQVTSPADGASRTGQGSNLGPSPSDGDALSAELRVQ